MRDCGPKLRGRFQPLGLRDKAMVRGKRCSCALPHSGGTVKATISGLRFSFFKDPSVFPVQQAARLISGLSEVPRLDLAKPCFLT